MAFNVKRLPYHRAPFYFAPEFLATPEQWQVSFKRLVNDVLRRQRIDVDASVDKDGPYGLVVRFGRAAFHVSALSGKFWIIDTEGQFDGPLLGSAPEEFLQHALNAPAKLKPIVRDVIIDFADNLILEMEVNFEEALRIGAARIEAQFNSRAAEFSSIEPRHRYQLQVFTGIDDDLSDEVDCERSDLHDAQFLDSGERLYSLGVVPTAEQNPQQKEKAKGGRPPTYDKDVLGRELDALMDYHGDFTPADPEWNAQARLAEAAIEICKGRFGNELSPATAKVEAKAAAERYRKRVKTN